MIVDSMKTEKFSQIKLPQLKGHVKIRLHNPNTWKTEVIEGDNMITDAVKDIFAANYCGALDYRKLLPLYSTMFGGIICFSSALDVSSEVAASDYFIPDNGVNTVTAHAGQTASSDQADDVKRGSPLTTAMTVRDGTVTLAWERGSAAGNGTIQSVGLTHTDVGDAGTGSNSNAFQAMKPVMNATFGLPTTNFVWFVDSEGYGYRFSCSGTSVTIRKIPLAYKQTGLVAGIPFKDTAQDDIHTLTTQTSFSNQPFYCFDYAHNNLWLFYSEGINPSTSVKCEQINISNWTVTNRDFTTDGTTVGFFANTGTPVQIPFDGTYVYLRRYMTNLVTSNGVLKMKLPPNHADQTFLNYVCRPYGGMFIPSAAKRVLVSKACVVNNGVVYPTATDDTMSNYGTGLVALPFTNSNPGVALIGGQWGEGLTPSYFVSVSKFYLATKYNLPSPVTKTASQSMTITYTLTEVEEAS